MTDGEQAMKHTWIEVSVKLIGEDYKSNVEVYNQRISYDYFAQAKSSMVAEIAAIVNDLPMSAPDKVYIHKEWPPADL
jgi:hypothetical protein